MLRALQRVLPSYLTSTSTASSANTVTSLSSDRSTAAHSRTTTGGVSSYFSSIPYVIRFHVQSTTRLLQIFAEHHLRICVFARPRDREVCSQGIFTLSRTYPCILLPLPLTMRLLNSCLILFLIFVSFEFFDFVLRVQLFCSVFARCLFFAFYFSVCPTADRVVYFRCFVRLLSWLFVHWFSSPYFPNQAENS